MGAFVRRHRNPDLGCRGAARSMKRKAARNLFCQCTTKHGASLSPTKLANLNMSRHAQRAGPNLRARYVRPPCDRTQGCPKPGCTTAPVSMHSILGNVAAVVVIDALRPRLATANHLPDDTLRNGHCRAAQAAFESLCLFSPRGARCLPMRALTSSQSAKSHGFKSGE